MSRAFRHVAPAGAPIGLGDLLLAAGSTLVPDVRGALARAIGARFEVRHAVATSTGRAGMTMLLRALRHLAPDDRTEVVLPSYTCYSLAASTMKAGLRPRIVDISPRTLDFDPRSLDRADFSRVLAIVASNLYGLPNDMPALSALARDRGVFLIDDAAQSMGARIGGRWSGTWGDAGIFSFDKGKPLSAIDGGVVVTNSDRVRAAWEAEVRALKAPRLTRSGVHLAKAVAYAALLRPWLYWIPQRIPQLGLGRTVYSTDFPIEAPDRFLSALGRTTLRHLDEFVRVRACNAAALLQSLKGVSRVDTIAPHAQATPSYLRLPLLVDSRGTREAVLDALVNAGIGATGSYPASLVDIPDLADDLGPQAREAEGGRHVADRIVTLPTHPYVTPGDISRMTAVLTRVVAAGRPDGQASDGGKETATPVCAG